MTIDKRISYVNQDGYKNYIKNSDSITIPKKFKARKEATSTHLAYITKAEAAQLKKQNKGTPHKGPKGIPSYDDFDAQGNYRSGAAMSAAESSGPQNERMRADLRAAGISPEEAAGIKEGAARAAAMGQRGSGIGGLLGALGRGALSIFGGIPGKLMSGIMTAKNWAQKRGQTIGEGVKEFSESDTLKDFFTRNKVQAIQPIESIPTNQEIIGTRVSQDQGYYGMGRQYDQSVMPKNLGTDNQFVEEEQDFNPNFLAPGSAEGGRIGYERGRVVNPGGYQGEEEGVDSIKHFIMLEQMDKLEKMIASGLDSDGRLQARLDQLIATPTTGFGTGPDLVLPDDMAQGGIARLL